MKYRFLYKILPWVISAYVLYYVVQHADSAMIYSLLQSLKGSKTLVQQMAFGACILLALSHPLLESYKWQLLLSTLRPTSLSQAWSMTMRGMSSALMMPNKTGDFIGKLYGMSRSQSLKAFALSGAGNLFQLLQTMLWGGISMAVLASQGWLQKLELKLPVSTYLYALGGGFLVLLLAYIFRDFIKKSKAYQLSRQSLKSIQNLSPSICLELFMVSALLYFLFISQYYLIFMALGSDLTWGQVFLAQSAVYFSLAFLPHTLLMDIALRAPLSLYFYTVYSASSGEVLLAAYSIYFLNILLPALIGLPYFKSTKAETQTQKNENYI